MIRGGARLTDIDLASAGNRATRFLPGVGGLLGSRITGVGDVDGNGVDDLAVGALSANFPSRGTAGSVMVLLGGPRFFRSATRTAAPGGGDILRLVGPLARASAGDVGRAGDVDRDGRADIVVAGGNASLKDRALAGGAWLYGYGADAPVRRGAAPGRPPGRGVRRPDPPHPPAAPDQPAHRPGRDPPDRRRGATPRGRPPGPRRLRRHDQRPEPGLHPDAQLRRRDRPCPAPAPQPITTAPPSGEPGNVRLTAQQLLINQRIYQAALLRSRSLAGRLNGRITGGDLDAGTITRGRFTPGLTLTAAGAVTSLPPTGSEARTAERRSGGRVTLSAAQLRINQRIAQVGVRTANDAISQIERGLINGNFADRSIGSEVLAPGVVSSR